MSFNLSYSASDLNAAIAAANAAAPQSTTYTKNEINTLLNAKANASALGTAAAADTTTSIASGGTGLPTSGTVYTDQQRQDTVIGSLVDKGAKNLSPVNNVIFTRPTGAAYTDPISINLASGEYVIRYKLTTTANAAVAITYDDSEHTFYDSSSPYSDIVITHNFTVVNSGTSFRFYFNQAATVSELMIVPKLIWDASNNYEPFALDNPTLTSALVKQVDDGAKNLSSINSVSNQQNYVDIGVNLKAGTYTLSVSSISTTSSDTSVRIGVYKAPNNLLYTYIDVGSNKTTTFTISSDADVVRIFPTSGAGASTGESVTFSDLMICTKADYDASTAYIPYAPTSR